MPDNLTRQQIYDRIRTSSKDSYILEEMKRLGFWEASDSPSLPEILIKREAELNKELQELIAKDRKYGNAEKMLKEMRKERMKKAREKRNETKQKNEQKRTEKSKRWTELQQQQIIYLGQGKGISKGLHNKENNAELLSHYNLPVYNDVTELTQSLHIDLATLRFLTYNRQVSKINHYYTFRMPKKSGGERIISAPKRQLKAVQSAVLENILNIVPVTDKAHGFIRERSILTNAQPHIAKDIVINVDLKDFFPSISFKRVKGLFKSLGYSEQQSVILALICTQAETDKVELDGVTYYVQKGERVLPQGSPASPAISNLIVYKMDKRIEGLASKLGFYYSRYADDLTFSASKEKEENISKLLFFLKKICESEGFTLHPQKTHVMRKGNLQKVTGIVVNEKQNIERTQLRKFRALLHNIETNGWKEQQWGKAENPAISIEGYIHFVQMVNPEKGAAYKTQFERIMQKYGQPPTTKPQVSIDQQESAPIIPEQPAQTEPKEKPASGSTDWLNLFS